MQFKRTSPHLDFPGGSDGKASACNVGDPGSIPGLERSPGEGNGNPLQYSCLEKSHGRRSLVDYSPWGRKESDMTEPLHFPFLSCHVIQYKGYHVVFFLLKATQNSDGGKFQAGGTAGEKALRLNATHLKNSLNDSSEPRAG